MTRSIVRRGIAVAALACITLAACGDDDADSETADSSTTTEETTTTTTEATTTTMSAEEAEADISAKTVQFFDLVGAQDFQSAVLLLENGESYLDELAHCADLVTGVSVEMQSVDVTGDTAMSFFAILLNGEVVLPESSGTAVLTDGEWLVGENTFLSLYDAAKEGCTGPPPAES